MANYYNDEWSSHGDRSGRDGEDGPRGTYSGDGGAAPGQHPGADPDQRQLCSHCGAEFGADEDKEHCLTCRRRGIPADNGDAGTGDRPDWEIQQLQFAVVPAISEHIAAAKGSVAVRQAVRQTSSVGRATPVYDFTAEVPDLYETRWGGALPRVTPIDSSVGQRLRRIAREDLGDYTSDTPADVDGIARFVDANGHRIEGDDRAALVEAAIAADPTMTADQEPTVWLLPAWTLSRPTMTTDTTLQIQGKCPRCEDYAMHQSIGTVSTPDDHLDIGLFECQECQWRTHGPPTTDPDRQIETTTVERTHTKRIEDRIYAPGETPGGDWAIPAGPFSPPDAGTSDGGEDSGGERGGDHGE